MLSSHFASLRVKGQKGLVVFVTAGDPTLIDLPRILDAVSEGGADVIELGLPFSDPIADGPVIQASSQRALDAGATLAGVLKALASWDNPRNLPVVLMGYLNPILAMGMVTFATSAKESGASAVLISDLTPEEATEWSEVARLSGLETIFLVAPTSTDDRISVAASQATGFVYAVSRTGVTGSQRAGEGQAEALVERIARATDLPICVGFGISSPEHVREVCAYADGAIVGSSIVKVIESSWGTTEGPEKLKEFVRSLKQATLLTDTNTG